LLHVNQQLHIASITLLLPLQGILLQFLDAFVLAFFLAFGSVECSNASFPWCCSNGGGG
jgi:hypothetical protein